jgi:hypothetical protein
VVGAVELVTNLVTNLHLGGRENVGTILAWLGVAFRFLSLAGQADAQTMGGIYDVPPIFLSARFRAACCPNITAKSSPSGLG